MRDRARSDRWAALALAGRAAGDARRRRRVPRRCRSCSRARRGAVLADRRQAQARTSRSRASATCAPTRASPCCSTTTRTTGSGCGGCASTGARRWFRPRRTPQALDALRAKYPQYARVPLIERRAAAPAHRDRARRRAGARRRAREFDRLRSGRSRRERAQRSTPSAASASPPAGWWRRCSDGRLESLRPDREHPVTRGFACNKGLAGVDIHHDPDRLNHPQRRRADGSLERASLGRRDSRDRGAQLRAIIAEHGPDAVASYIGQSDRVQHAGRTRPRARSSRSSAARRSFSSGTQDCANKFAGSEAVFGSSTIHPIPDLAHTELLLVFGANPRVSHGSFISIADPRARSRTRASAARSSTS